MSILQNSVVAAGASGQGGAYSILRSVRSRSGASGYWSRSNRSVVTSNNVWTWSGWRKLGDLSNGNAIVLYGTGAPGSTDECSIKLQNNQLEVINYVSSVVQARRITNAVRRDPSGWYHFCVSNNGSTGLSVEVNGALQTYATSVGPSAAAWALNSASVAVRMGAPISGIFQYFDGLQADDIFVDGQALAASNFGEFDSLVPTWWKPKRYAGSYGLNGGYWNYSDNSAATAAAIGKDSSGNGNNWTPNNISLTAGVTYDSMTDVPTLTSATAANYCVLNPLDKYSSITVSGGNLDAICADVAWRSGAMTFGKVTTGKWYYEVTATNIGGSTYISAGWELSSLDHTAQSSGVGGSSSSNSFGVLINTNLRQTKANTVTVNSDANVNANGDVIMIAVDFDAGKGWVGKNGTWYDSGNPSSGTSPCTTNVSGGMTPAYQTYNNGGLSANFGQRPFSYTPPTGFLALNAYNLAESTIKAGNKHFDVSLWTGNGTSQSIVNAGGFDVGFAWIKSRSNATYNILTDIVRGTNKQLFSNDTLAEESRTDRVTAFNANGFSVGAWNDVNQSGSSFAGFQWKGGGAAVTNNAGSISAQVSANSAAGFSIVVYNGNGTNGATVGHGLGVKPSLIIEKGRTTTYNWPVQGCGVLWPTATQTLFLNGTNALNSGSGVAAPTSSVFTPSATLYANESGVSNIALVFAPIPGFSAFGTFIGNGLAEGPHVNTGFKSRWIAVKRIDSVGDWVIKDTARDPYNVMSTYLYPNASNAEGSGAFLIDCLSNGFKVRDSFGSWNASGGTYMYMAFAESPFKYANAR